MGASMGAVSWALVKNHAHATSVGRTRKTFLDSMPTLDPARKLIIAWSRASTVPVQRTLMLVFAKRLTWVATVK